MSKPAQFFKFDVRTYTEYWHVWLFRGCPHIYTRTIAPRELNQVLQVLTLFILCVCVCADQVFEQQQRAVRLFTAQPSTGVERGTHREFICSLVNLFCNLSVL